MDKNILVTAGTTLINALDQEGVNPRAAVWVYNSETDSWRLWIVPSKSATDKRQFYRLVSEAITKHKDSMQGLDASDTEFVRDTHPAIQALSRMFRVEGASSVSISNNMLNGFYVPDGIVLRMAV
jgi:hypothetical protein